MYNNTVQLYLRIQINYFILQKLQKINYSTTFKKYIFSLVYPGYFGYCYIFLGLAKEIIARILYQITGTQELVLCHNKCFISGWIQIYYLVYINIQVLCISVIATPNCLVHVIENANYFASNFASNFASCFMLIALIYLRNFCIIKY